MDANEGKRSWLSLGALLAAVLILSLAAPGAPATLRALQTPTAWVHRVGADAAAARLAALVLVALAAWTTLGLTAGLLARAPGALGRAADRCARVVLPRALYRLAAGAAGVGIVLTPATGALAGTTASSSVVAGVDPAPGWPSDASLRAPGWPTGGSAGPTAQPPRHRVHAPATVTRVLVRPGDSLWSIAADHLPASARPAAVARSWPRWYGANRAVIGTDPNLLFPGEVLVTPSSSAQELP